MTPSFPERLATACRRAGTPLVAGIDPHWEDLPPGLRPAGAGPAGTNPAQACEQFARGLLDACADACAAVKIQVACFERFGAAGFSALERVLADARARGIVTIADAKRGDIASTAKHYAEAYLAPGAPLESDALTIQSVFGADGVAPFLDFARHGKGLFPLLRTSNPSAGALQDLDSGGRPWHMHLAGLLAGWAAPHRDATGYSALGAVVGATHPAAARALRAALPGIWLLCPGIGAQGGDEEAVRALADPAGLGVLPVVARGIGSAFRDPGAPPDWAAAARAACRRYRERFPLAAARG